MANTLRDALLPEFDAEMARTRRTLERVPDDKLDYKPHPKSGSLGWLASHVAGLPNFIHTAVTKDGLEMCPDAAVKPLASREAILANFDENVAKARAAIAEASDEAFARNWQLTGFGRTWFSGPKWTVVREMAFNHLIHHRAQLGVYLRLNDVAIPATYGPSADEMPA